jgi:hypothetical protein
VLIDTVAPSGDRTFHFSLTDISTSSQGLDSRSLTTASQYWSGPASFCNAAATEKGMLNRLPTGGRPDPRQSHGSGIGFHRNLISYGLDGLTLQASKTASMGAWAWRQAA